MDPLQWMGVIKIKIQTSDKNIIAIHTTPVHQLMSCGMKSCMFLRNKSIIKGIVHPKMKIRLCFTHLRSIAGVCVFLHSDESNQSYIKNIFPSLTMGINRCLLDQVQKTWNNVHAFVIKHPSHGSGGWIKAPCREFMHFWKISIFQT